MDQKLGARAEVDVGATSHVHSGSWSDWTTTAYREPDCSCRGRAVEISLTRWVVEGRVKCAGLPWAPIFHAA